jgi:hypothetical protein
VRREGNANGVAVKLMFRLGGCCWRSRVRIRSSHLYGSTTSICFSRNDLFPFHQYPFNRAAAMIIVRSGMAHLVGGLVQYTDGWLSEVLVLCKVPA